MNKTIEYRICTDCGTKKLITEFAHRGYNKNGHKAYKHQCKTCRSHHEKIVYRLKKKHPLPENHRCDCCGVTEKEFEEKTKRSIKDYGQYTTRGYEKKKIWCLDHDHKTGQFRGWVCFHCNNRLGQGGDDNSILLKTIEYNNRYMSKRLLNE